MNRIVFSGIELKSFKRALLKGAPLESAGIILARPGRGASGLRFVVDAAEIADGVDYVKRSPNLAVLSPAFVARYLKIARDKEMSVFLVHTHPAETWPSFSPVDDGGEKAISTTLYDRAPDGPHGSLVFGTEGFAARTFDAKGQVTGTIDRILEVSSVIKVCEQRLQPAVSEMYDRNVRAFGREGQQLLQSLHVGIVGVGGTGSFVVEELARLGVGQLTLIDDECVELSNLNRLIGSGADDVGRPKVDVLSEVALRASANVELVRIPESVIKEQVARRLVDCDAVFCCTDSHGSRAVINQISYQYLVPTFDIGVRIDAERGKVTGATSRVQMLGPGLPCLACYPLLSAEAVRRDLLTRDARDQDPYIVGYHEPQPAVVSINGAASSSAVTMFLTAVTGLPSSARHLVGHPLEGTVRAAIGTPRPDCVVCSQQNAFRRADSWPVMWQS